MVEICKDIQDETKMDVCFDGNFYSISYGDLVANLYPETFERDLRSFVDDFNVPVSNILKLSVNLVSLACSICTMPARVDLVDGIYILGNTYVVSPRGRIKLLVDGDDTEILDTLEFCLNKWTKSAYDLTLTCFKELTPYISRFFDEEACYDVEGVEEEDD